MPLYRRLLGDPAQRAALLKAVGEQVLLARSPVDFRALSSPEMRWRRSREVRDADGAWTAIGECGLSKHTLSAAKHEASLKDGNRTPQAGCENQAARVDQVE